MKIRTVLMFYMLAAAAFTAAAQEDAACIRLLEAQTKLERAEPEALPPADVPETENHGLEIAAIVVGSIAIVAVLAVAAVAVAKRKKR